MLGEGCSELRFYIKFPSFEILAINLKFKKAA